jgi:hypothetical protein
MAITLGGGGSTLFTIPITKSTTTPPEPTAEEAARMWRDMELSATDYIVPLTDHPQRAAYMAYREALRDWPSTDSFPDTRPEL